MSKDTKKDLSGRLAEVAVHGMQEKKGNDIVRLDMRNVNATLSDYFVICHADSAAQINAIASSVEEEVYKVFGQEPWRKEGGQWRMDFVGFCGCCRAYL